MGIGYKILNNILQKSTCLKVYRTIMTSSSRCAEAVEELKKNPYYEKYAQKIAKLQQTSPDEFLSRIEQQKDKTEPKLSNSASRSKDERNYSTLLTPKEKLEGPKDDQKVELDKIIKLDLVKDLEAQEIEKIWHEYHIKKDFISASIPSKNYEVIFSKAKEFPTFLFPIPRSQGYEFIVAQFSANTVHFTPLLYFQVHKENSPECLTMVHYTEFEKSKGIVLMRGEFDKNVLNVQEAQCLANQLQLYYGQDDPGRTRLLETFTKKPDEFKHMELVKNIETLSL